MLLQLIKNKHKSVKRIEKLDITSNLEIIFYHQICETDTSMTMCVTCMTFSSPRLLKQYPISSRNFRITFPQCTFKMC